MHSAATRSGSIASSVTRTIEERAKSPTTLLRRTDMGTCFQMLCNRCYLSDLSSEPFVTKECGMKVK